MNMSWLALLVSLLVDGISSYNVQRNQFDSPPINGYEIFDSVADGFLPPMGSPTEFVPSGTKTTSPDIVYPDQEEFVNTKIPNQQTAGGGPPANSKQPSSLSPSIPSNSHITNNNFEQLQPRPRPVPTINPNINVTPIGSHQSQSVPSNNGQTNPSALPRPLPSVPGSINMNDVPPPPTNCQPTQAQFGTQQINQYSTQAVKHSIHNFMLDLQHLITSPLNTVMSPFSLSSLMALLSLGTSGHTKHELLTELDFQSFDIKDLHQEFQNILSSILRPNRGVEINIASRLFLSSGINVYKSFTDNTCQYYNAGVQLEDFAKAPYKAVSNINNWVNRQTNGKIPKLVDSPFNPNTKLVAANTVYFNGAWQFPFPEMFTTNRTFYGPSRNMSIPFMIHTMNVSHVYSPDINSDVIALFYKQAEFAMYFILPRGKSNQHVLASIENHLESEKFNRLLESMSIVSDANIFLPRMKLRFRAFLKPLFQKLFISSIFEPNSADFSAMSSAYPLFVEDIVHETVVDITEKGTEAAAVSSVSFDRSGGGKVFRMNKPMITFIRDIPNKVNLFWGRIIEPEPIL